MRRLVICGSPGSNQKRLFEALAKYLGAPPPRVTQATAESPFLVSGEVVVPDVGRVLVETLAGPGFHHEEAVADFMSRPLAAVLYVLWSAAAGFEEAHRRFDLANFALYAAKSAIARDVPWVFVRYGFKAPAGTWTTEVIPSSLRDSSIAVNASTGSGVGDIVRAITIALG